MCCGWSPMADSRHYANAYENGRARAFREFGDSENILDIALYIAVAQKKIIIREQAGLYGSAAYWEGFRSMLEELLEKAKSEG